MRGSQDTGHTTRCLGLFLPQPSPRLRAALLTGFGWGACHQQEREQEFLQVLHHSVLGLSGSPGGKAESGVSSCSQQGFIA